MDSSSNKVMSMILVLVTILCTRAMAQSSCTSVLIGLAPCLSFVSGSSATPSSSCCSQLTSVVQSRPRCLCLIVNSGGGASLGVTINQTLALALPGACKVQTPPVSNCHDGSPESPPGITSTGSSVPGGSKVSPANIATSSGGLPATMPALQLIFLSLFSISFAMTFGNV